MRSVLASRPVARAKSSRACLGFTTATGSPAVAKAAATGPSKPPVASRITSTGRSSRRRATSVSVPAGSLGTRGKVYSPSPASRPRRTQTSRRRSLETSTPAVSLRALMDHRWHTSLVLWPVLADAGSPLFASGGPWQLFGLFAKRGARRPYSFSCGLFGPGPEPVCRARPVDSTTADKIQGPELLRTPAQGSLSSSCLGLMAGDYRCLMPIGRRRL
jgi:hypothetical protein